MILGTSSSPCALGSGKSVWHGAMLLQTPITLRLYRVRQSARRANCNG